MKANNHQGFILVAASDKTPSSPCEQKQDEKPIASIHLVIHLSESSFQHHKSIIIFSLVFVLFLLYDATVLFALQVPRQLKCTSINTLKYLGSVSSGVFHYCRIWIYSMYCCSVFSLILCLQRKYVAQGGEGVISSADATVKVSAHIHTVSRTGNSLCQHLSTIFSFSQYSAYKESPSNLPLS